MPLALIILWIVCVLSMLSAGPSPRSWRFREWAFFVAISGALLWMFLLAPTDPDGAKATWP